MNGSFVYADGGYNALEMSQVSSYDRTPQQPPQNSGRYQN